LELVYATIDQNDAAETHWMPVSSLLPADSPRQAGEDIQHTRMLARIDERLPPIIVHRSTMRVIDGMHRLGAALLRGDEMIEVRLFEGSEKDAFLLAVHSNIEHGLPLSPADRISAAERIVTSHPTWSDRAIALAAGISARAVGNIRGRLQVGRDADIVRMRIGRDGRVRPLDNSEGRLKASAIIEERPRASLREIAREAGISASTVRDVRHRVERGEDPVPQKWRRRDSAEPGEATVNRLPEGPGLASMLQGLQTDPSLRFTESGRGLLRWVLARAIRSDERVGVVDKVPPHCSYIMVNVARACADEWLKLANALEQRGIDQE
jgi:hypothetical protein